MVLRDVMPRSFVAGTVIPKKPGFVLTNEELDFKSSIMKMEASGSSKI
jgi:hypothetical protein